MLGGFLSVTPVSAETVSYWRLEEASTPTEGYSNEVKGGVRLGAADQRQMAFPSGNVPTNLPAGLVNQNCAEFIPSQQSCLVPPDATVGDFKERGAFTIECWFYLREYPPTPQTQKSLFHKRANASAENTMPHGYQMGVTADHILAFWAGTADGTGKALRSKSEIALNTWTHVAITRDTTGNFTLYLNGKQEDVSKGALPGSLASEGPLYIGANRFMRSKAPYWDGFIDEIRISDQALTPGQMLIGTPNP